MSVEWINVADKAPDEGDNVLVTTNKPLSSYRRMFEKDPPYVRNLRTYGEIGIVAYHNNKKVRGKLDDRGRPCVFVGYPRDHCGDVYRMLDVETKGVINT